jgi:hypothetical protein
MHESNSKLNKNMMSQFMGNYPHRSLVFDPDESALPSTIGSGDYQFTTDYPMETWNNEIDPDTIADYQRSLDMSGHLAPEQVWSEEEILRVEEAAKAAEAWKKELARWAKASGVLQKENKKIAELEQGMLTSRLEAEAEAKAKEAERKALEAKAAEAKRIAEEEAKRKAEEEAKISKDVANDLDKDSGRSKPVKMENLRGEKPGFVMAEGTNWWSVDEKDDYWQTKEGHKEAMNLYGQKPAWVKESTLEYNPKTGKYDSIKKEEFVEIKPKKRISL